MLTYTDSYTKADPDIDTNVCANKHTHTNYNADNDTRTDEHTPTNNYSRTFEHTKSIHNTKTTYFYTCNSNLSRIERYSLHPNSRPRNPHGL